jgi:hypothetical protein
MSKPLSEVSDVELATAIRLGVSRVKCEGMGQIKGVVARLKALGITKDSHTVSSGASRPKLSERQAMEWYAGQLIAIVDERKHWPLMNTFLNSVEVFVPRVF